jgi:hypothetical protein
MLCVLTPCYAARQGVGKKFFGLNFTLGGIAELQIKLFFLTPGYAAYSAEFELCAMRLSAEFF